MKAFLVLLVIVSFVFGGCVSKPVESVKHMDPEPELEPERNVRPVVVNDLPNPHRRLTEKQENLLRTFALKESPQLWQTVQLLRGEIDSRNRAMVQLAADLREFDRKPEEDTTYRELQVGREQIACTLDNVYQKLENAYIAYKKFLATPGRKEYADAMSRALEDGMHEAEATAQRYRVMAEQK